MLSIAVMFIMPLLYSGMLLWAFWNPYGHLENLPVALVNNDEGYEFEGEQLQLGDELVENLRDNASFKFIETSSKEAEEMLAEQQAYIVIEIPAHFSQHATTLLDEQPQKLELKYKVDEASNFLSSKIGDSAINQIQTEVNEEVATTYAEQLFEVITTLSDGYGDAAQGADELTSGIDELKAGTTDLKGYLQQLASSTVTLSDGTKELASGISAATDGAAKLENGSAELASGTEQLAAGTEKLQQGALQVADGMTALNEGIQKASAGSSELVAGQRSLEQSMQQLASSSAQLADGTTAITANNSNLASSLAVLNTELSVALEQLPEEQRVVLQQAMMAVTASSTELAAKAEQVAQSAQAIATGTAQAQAGQQQLTTAAQSLEEGLQQLTTSGTQLAAGATKVATSTTSVSDAANKLHDGAQQITSNVAKLHDGLNDMNAGSNKLTAGTATLNEKSHELAIGSERLVTGNEQLFDGSLQLKDKLQQANEDSTLEVSDANYSMIAAPVDVDKTIENKVANYGTGLAPYFISLGLFVGALLLTNVYPFVQPAVRPTGAWSWFISKSAVPFVVWLAQTTILSAFLLFVLKLDVTNVPLFIALIAAASFAFIAIVQVLTVMFDDVGRFIALVFLILQLASSAGTFPVELLPKALQSFHSYMPMSYTVEALRTVISSTDYSIVYSNIALLCTIGVLCTIVTMAFFKLLYTRRYSKQQA